MKFLLIIFLLLGVSLCQINLKQFSQILVADLEKNDLSKLQADVKSFVDNFKEFFAQSKDVQPLVNLGKDLDALIVQVRDKDYLSALQDLKQVLTVDLKNTLVALKDIDTKIQSIVPEIKKQSTEFFGIDIIPGGWCCQNFILHKVGKKCIRGDINFCD